MGLREIMDPSLLDMCQCGHDRGWHYGTGRSCIHRDYDYYRRVIKCPCRAFEEDAGA